VSLSGVTEGEGNPIQRAVHLLARGAFQLNKGGFIMKRTCFFVILVAGFLGLLCGTSLAMSFTPVSDLSGWDEDQWKPNNPVAITHPGSTVSFIADGAGGDYAWGSIYTILSDSIGITAEVNVSAARGNVAIGIRKYIATTDSGTRLSAEMQVVRYNDHYKIEYYLKEKDSSGMPLRQLGAGNFGEWGTGAAEWRPGEGVFLGLALVGNEVWFYSPGYGTLVKVQILTPFTPSDDYIQVNGYAEPGPGNRIEGTVKNVNIVYP